jgi:hypothetical protein
MKIASTTISHLRHFIQRREPLLGVNAHGGKLSFFRYDPLDLAAPYHFLDFFYCFHEEDCPCNICSGCYVLNNIDSYSRLSRDVEKEVQLLFPSILVLVLLWLANYFSGCGHARNLGIAT